ncbi:hypothetical protein OPV22_004671 [Ensete ventricosum]|uniref:Uncharacterized protein n=1 Tax=Ensete ventricosum TaxID=4639 RepID=A0AAV8RB56_ENSVE|nr:hypothetical protein OPV22_004671 [Ensete ventricosum]
MDVVRALKRQGKTLYGFGVRAMIPLARSYEMNCVSGLIHEETLGVLSMFPNKDKITRLPNPERINMSVLYLSWIFKTDCIILQCWLDGFCWEILVHPGASDGRVHRKTLLQQPLSFGSSLNSKFLGFLLDCLSPIWPIDRRLKKSMHCIRSQIVEEIGMSAKVFALCSSSQALRRGRIPRKRKLRETCAPLSAFLLTATTAELSIALCPSSSRSLRLVPKLDDPISIDGDASSSCDGVLDAAASVLDHSMFH